MEFFELSERSFPQTSYLFFSLFWIIFISPLWFVVFLELKFRVLAHFSKSISGLDISLSAQWLPRRKSLTFSLHYLVSFNSRSTLYFLFWSSCFFCTFVLNSRFFSLRETFDFLLLKKLLNPYYWFYPFPLLINQLKSRGFFLRG